MALGKSLDACNTAYDNTVITDPNGEQKMLIGLCKEDPELQDAERAKDNLRALGAFFVWEDDAPIVGQWKVKSSEPLWALDGCAELGEAIGAFATMLGCVACCCMGPDQKNAVPVGTPQTVGAVG